MPPQNRDCQRYEFSTCAISQIDKEDWCDVCKVAMPTQPTEATELVATKPLNSFRYLTVRRENNGNVEIGLYDEPDSRREAIIIDLQNSSGCPDGVRVICLTADFWMAGFTDTTEG